MPFQRIRWNHQGVIIDYRGKALNGAGLNSVACDGRAVEEVGRQPRDRSHLLLRTGSLKWLLLWRDIGPSRSPPTHYPLTTHSLPTLPAHYEFAAQSTTCLPRRASRLSSLTTRRRLRYAANLTVTMHPLSTHYGTAPHTLLARHPENRRRSGIFRCSPQCYGTHCLLTGYSVLLAIGPHSLLVALTTEGGGLSV